MNAHFSFILASKLNTNSATNSVFFYAQKSGYINQLKLETPYPNEQNSK